MNETMNNNEVEVVEVVETSNPQNDTLKTVGLVGGSILTGAAVVYGIKKLISIYNTPANKEKRLRKRLDKLENKIREIDDELVQLNTENDTESTMDIVYFDDEETEDEE